MTTILFENIQKYIIKDLVNIIIKYLAFSGYKEIISTDVPQHPNYCSNLVLSPNRRLVAYASKNIVKLYDLYSNKLLKTIETFHRIDGINFTNNSTLVYVNNDGIITKHNLQNDTDDITMILNTNQDNNKTNISLILLEEDETVENVYINNEFIRTGYYAIVMPTSSTTSSTTRSTSSSENIILSDMCYSIVINNKKYELQETNYGTTEGIYLDRNNNLLVLRVDEYGSGGMNIHYYNNIQVIDINNFNIIHKFGISTDNPVTNITILKNNDIAVTNSLRLISILRNYKILYTLIGHTGVITTIVELDSNDKDILLVSASHDNTLKFWKNDTLIKSIVTDTVIVNMLVLSSNLLILLCITDDSKLFIYS